MPNPFTNGDASVTGRSRPCLHAAAGAMNDAECVASATVLGRSAAASTRDLECGERTPAHEVDAGTSFVKAQPACDRRLHPSGVRNSGCGRALAESGVRKNGDTWTVGVV